MTKSTTKTTHEPLELTDIWRHLLDRIAKCEQDEASEERRLARIQCGYATLGFTFGPFYMLFYGAVGFWFAVVVIGLCTVANGMGIAMMRSGKSLAFTGNWLTGVLVCGFAALIYGEGGITAHAAAWLAGAPLCGLMMIGSRAAWFWTGVSLAILSVYFVIELMGIQLGYLYEPRWHTLVAGLGFLGLGPFLFAVALTFELTRSRAVAAKERALVKLEIANERLVLVNEEKDQFLGIAAHDLRNPLGIIDGYTQMIMTRDDLPSAAHKQLNTILQSTTRMAGILDDLLNLNAIEHGNYPLKSEVIELGGVAEECVESASMTAKAKNTQIRMVIKMPLNQAVADKRALGQVLDNLISNAVKYSPKSSVIQVVSRQDGNRAILEVIDQGPGFSEADRKKLFQRFAKLSARPTGGESSTGLGLSIVKRITEAMDGEVECLAGEGCGTRFQLSFQAVEPHAVSEEVPAHKTATQ